jgi:glycosyltransferase involved in cell wall biosynthesis
MKVVILPFNRQNPYQQSLADSLSSKGVELYFDKLAFPFAILTIAFKYWKVDILHVHWVNELAASCKNRFWAIMNSIVFAIGLALLKIHKLCGEKIVWTVHNVVSHEPLIFHVELFLRRILAKLCDKIIVHSLSAKRAVEDAYKISESSKIVVIPHGNYINSYKNTIGKDEARQNLRLSKEDKVFLFFGNIRTYKGIFEIIEAFRQLNLENTKLIIAGKPLTNKIAEEAKRACGGNKNIIFSFGFVPNDMVQAYMNAADIVVLPYRDVATSGAAILAMSFGKPIIAPNIGPIPEILDEEGSFLYESPKKGALLNALHEAMKSDLKKMGNHNRSRAEIFGWGEIADKTFEVYKECLK